MKSPLRTLIAVASFVLVLVLVLVLGRSLAARRAFERELASARILANYHPPEPEMIVDAALRVPRSTALLAPLAEALESDDCSTRLFAATVIAYWDAHARADGKLPRPEHHEQPIEELLPLLPAIAAAQRIDESVDMCLVTVWNDETLLQCIEHGMRPSNMHSELVGILVNEDPRPKEKDGFSGLVYGYAFDEQLRARMKK
jgi:hypothetical protein